ncbi:hypothetical protein [Microcoleus sp. herbarium2]|uniref:hypothetical protein n=1 Tax=Microcoleus sp. herbarium2 TaxID=3055433 RepID=UPI002FD65ED6
MRSARVANYLCRVRSDRLFFILLNYFCAIALWKLWKKKLTACWALLVAKNYLWKTCGKAGAVDRPSVLVQKLF